eukprot:EW706451.1.p6 GENE.EW706451.1~~EW706451.1.p6  ORF type:complete len:61 (-),score=2.46 EW706451.1:349-531(-)
MRHHKQHKTPGTNGKTKTETQRAEWEWEGGGGGDRTAHTQHNSTHARARRGAKGKRRCGR